jgi:altronate dehydratase
VFQNVDGIKLLNHQGGCGGTRQDAAMLSKLLAAYADHPNVGGITVLSLGCQHLQVGDFVMMFVNVMQTSISHCTFLTAAVAKRRAIDHRGDKKNLFRACRDKWS